MIQSGALGEGVGVVVEVVLEALKERLAVLLGVRVLVAEEADRRGLGLWCGLDGGATDLGADSLAPILEPPT